MSESSMVANNKMVIESYRAATVLNNRGVSLLELNQYQEAMDMFTKAFVSFNNVTVPSIDSDDDPESPVATSSSSTVPKIDTEKIHQILTQTSTLLVKARKSLSLSDLELLKEYKTTTKKVKQQQQSTESKTTTTSSFRIVCLCAQDNVNRNFVDAALTSQVDTDVHIIRMDVHVGTSISNLDVTSYLFELSILLFNLATSCYCFAYTLFTLENQEQLKFDKYRKVAKSALNRSKFLYQMTISIIEISNLDTSNNNNTTTDCDISIHCALLIILSYQGLLQVTKVKTIATSTTTSTDIEERQKYYRSIADQRHKLRYTFANKLSTRSYH